MDFIHTPWILFLSSMDFNHFIHTPMDFIHTPMDFIHNPHGF
jgi:hypothetical protein